MALACIMIIACQSHETAAPAKKLSPDEQISHNIDSLKKIASEGDLIVRLGDDMISYQIKFLGEKDRSYSHAGVITEKDGRKWVTHITPEAGLGDTIQLTPIDSFITPGKNLRCALYRYNLTPTEKDSLRVVFDRLRQKHIRFDRVYDITTNDRMYCSEMISKSLTEATNHRLTFKTNYAPMGMIPLLTAYFKPEHLTREMIIKRQFVTIDNLYLRPECTRLMEFPLKFFPGNEQQ